MLRNPMRLSWILTIITSTLLFSGYSAWAQTPLTDCDRLAANTTDARKHSSAPGVPFKQVRENVNAALSACADAVKSFPNELRFQYQYARALQIRDKKSASQLFVKLSENGYPAAFDNVGWIQISENNDYDAAIRAFRKGYELGDADCAVSLFEMIEREKWKPENEKQIRITLLEKAAAANHAGAVVALPIERAKHGTASNDSTAAAPNSAAASTTTNDQQQPQAQPKIPTQAPAQAQAPNPSTTKALTESKSAYICEITERDYVDSIQIDFNKENNGLAWEDLESAHEKSKSANSTKLNGNSRYHTLTLSRKGISIENCKEFDDLIATAKPFASARKAKAEQIQSIRHQYKSREKTLLEQVANYTSFGDEGGDGCPDRCWVQIEHCVVARETNKTIIIDFRKFNQTAFRIESYVLQGYGEQASWNIGAFTGVADASWALIKYDTGITAITTSSIPTNWATSAFKVSFPTVDRLSKAWGLAFKECPGKKSTF